MAAALRLAAVAVFAAARLLPVGAVVVEDVNLTRLL